MPDVDAAGILFGRDLYERYHHLLAHNLLFGVAVTLVAAHWVGLRAGSLGLVFAAFLSHLVGDYFGSGPGWGISPYLPFSDYEYLCPFAWNLSGWQNTTITTVAIVITLAIAARFGYTPLETFAPATDRLVVDTIRLRVQTIPCRACSARAWFRCATCGEPFCETHTRAAGRVARRCATCAEAPA